jgi:hypothetical protein
MSNPETAQAHDSSSTSDPAAAMVLTAEPSTVPDTAEQAHGTSGKAENGNGKVKSEVVPAVAAAVTSEKLAPPLAAATTALSDPAATDVTNDNNDRKDGNVENGNNKVLAPEKVPAVATAAAVPSEKLAPPVEAATTMDVSATCLTDENNDDTNDMKDVDVDDNDDIDEVDEEEEFGARTRRRRSQGCPDGSTQGSRGSAQTLAGSLARRWCSTLVGFGARVG